eukprot:166296-Rhodomonas_salina.2
MALRALFYDMLDVTAHLGGGGKQLNDGVCLTEARVGNHADGGRGGVVRVGEGGRGGGSGAGLWQVQGGMRHAQSEAKSRHGSVARMALSLAECILHALSRAECILHVPAPPFPSSVPPRSFTVPSPSYPFLCPSLPPSSASTPPPISLHQATLRSIARCFGPPSRGS